VRHIFGHSFFSLRAKPRWVWRYWLSFPFQPGRAAFLDLREPILNLKFDDSFPSSLHFSQKPVNAVTPPQTRIRLLASLVALVGPVTAILGQFAWDKGLWKAGHATGRANC
jgi:hypothetical protein